MIKINLIRPMVSKVIEISTSKEIVVDYEMYELLRTNQLLFNTMYKGIPMSFELDRFKTLKDLETITDFYPKDQIGSFINTVTRFGENVYIYSIPEIDFCFYSHWEKDKMFFAQWFTDAGDSSRDYNPITITTVRYQHEVETLIDLNRSFNMWCDFETASNPLIIQNEE